APLHIPIWMRYWPPISGRARKRPPPSGKNKSVGNDSSHRSRHSRHRRGPDHFQFAHCRARDRAFFGGAVAWTLHREIWHLVRQAALDKENQRRPIFARLAALW